MNSLILQIASKYIKALFLIFAFIALLRGHNYPGGGFIGGLLAALSIAYSSLAYSTAQTKKRLWMQPRHYIGTGLLFMVFSLLPSVLQGAPLMKGIWVMVDVPVLNELKLGTPFLFDIGVFMAVIGVTLMFLFTLSMKK